ncbi:hypothetical protein COR50_20925 [Chitinophaga caeni]|uniref:Uncharacterized protein n=1 Tax=Chitinophaga caeni TaxID=2029983 RepID=A0A291QZR1_9BACT|nr:hypothetical protein COR50_20925 [Chitinophaga caeni]
MDSLTGQGHKQRMSYSAPPTKQWNFALLIAKPYSITKAGSSDQIGDVMANLCQAKKYIEMCRWTLNRTFEAMIIFSLKI